MVKPRPARRSAPPVVPSRTRAGGAITRCVRGRCWVNMFTESGNTGAPFLIESADVDMVSFTGSNQVGRMIAAAGAKTLKRMNLELGGKTPMIVFDDAALASTLPLLAASVTTFAGQNCVAGSRILVQRGIADQVREHWRNGSHTLWSVLARRRTPRWAPDRLRCRGTC